MVALNKLFFKSIALDLLANKLRSLLAILGVLVGTASVVALMSSSQLATTHALSQFKKLGTNLLSVYVIAKNNMGNRDRDDQSFQLSDMPKLKSYSRRIVHAAPYVINGQSMHFEGMPLHGDVVGVTERFLDITKIHIFRGRFISDLDHQKFYCVIGNEVAKKIHYSPSAVVGKQMHVGNFIFTIIGVLKKTQNNFFVPVNMNNSIFIPIQASYILNTNTRIQNILVQLRSSADMDEAKNSLQTKLQRLLPTQKILFLDPQQLINLIKKERATYADLLIAIGCISLVVGGIGVMNIMLVSVVERRREIGIRMAIGATQSDIVRLFLTESVMLTLFGGLLGVVIGQLTSYGLAFFHHWEFYFYLMPILLGFTVSVLVGIISGFYPALRASRLNPIEALMME
ncbi:MAG: hypothetical protein ACD_70C00139G0006 [uncultured bacterium]|nr:MAG: hypothetical protein ACD_70C00139G0006 [uncultured bacterium]OGT27003.1 MAG: hypothetical protein A3B71_04645 [Gammaproteobacteria bacterium RIFCSPHIGHO2_02_FULL_42_43]OGT27636.1 MAG: hypothetical protein A2624_02530 [Gammaproteobacteria bacterium RIFCSPHIGHO2_01_FULL_42_8]OGT53151.1 MAG: hypothetical protein A3E54_08505 [Gammaproteobacteria bacterium RIFCSPHIGHO2_12_FULL_41_25]OGT60980.1 MAG: hypothetical protein A3I77_00855 [Gammaproteobacteria bacterium RIFCSPLOWO2_02_FULL_42_14]OGT